MTGNKENHQDQGYFGEFRFFHRVDLSFLFCSGHTGSHASRTAAHQTSLSIRIVFPPMTLAISVSL